MIALGGFISGILGDHIEVTVSPDLLTFKYDGLTQTFEPIIYVAPGSHQLLGIGTAQIPSIPYIKVELFGATASGEISINKQDCLTKFFRHTLSRLFFVCPRITFYGSNSLNHILGGYHRGILFNAVTQAGARECHFTDKRQE